MDPSTLNQPIQECLERDDPRALELIFDAYGSSLLGYLLSLLCNKQDAEDCFQNLFILIAQKRNVLRGKENLKGYLMAMARNEAMGFFRKMKRNINTVNYEEAFLVSSPGEEPQPVEELSRALSGLPFEQREVISLKIYSQMTFDEISQHIGASPNTVASRYRYGIQKMKNMLQKLL